MTQVLLCSAAIVTLSMGIRHGFGLWLQPITMDRGWSRETFALAMAVQNLAWGLFGPLAGMVADRFEAHGYDVWNLGADMPGSDLGWLLSDRKVDLIAIGATLALHVGAVRSTIALLRAAPTDAHAPILVGGGPFAVVPDLWRIVGADAVANEPDTAVRRAEELLARG